MTAAERMRRYRDHRKKIVIANSVTKMEGKSSMTNPSQTIAYLDELEQLGFTNEAYWRVHHFREKNERDTINAHRKYCERTISFGDDKNNERVQKRLALILQYYKDYHLGNPAIFSDLADAAYRLIPPLQTSR